ncbi:MAG: AAA family ATPase [Microcystaceae cyanobacterium]
MKLLKVTVPNFRNLQNVELTFEPSLQPSVFPIGSENGGGKSTLLQLIFVLLTCWKDEEKKQYLRNFIYSSSNMISTIAQIKVLYKDQEIEFDFVNIDSKQFEESQLEKERIYYEILKNKELIAKLNEDMRNNKQKEQYLLEQWNYQMDDEDRKAYRKERQQIQNKLAMLENEIKQKTSEMPITIEEIRSKMDILFSISNLHTSSSEITEIMHCKSNLDNYDLAQEALKYASEHIYLATPPTQPYLFLDRESKRQLLTHFGEYQTKIYEFREIFPNIHSYNQFSSAAMLHAFTTAKEQDFKKALDNIEYGNSFQNLIKDYHQFLGNDKYIFPNEDLTSIIVRRKISDNEFVELEPEDLSHGELKRLGLYSWIKYGNINDSIILIDEIENGLHPDWQYNIVGDLAEWGDNQYLLATHSFYLCEALTPRHVKIIEPKLSNPCPENDDTSEP